MRSWAKQAIAQGITWIAASGDSGAAACYQSSGGPFGPASDSLALAVDLPAGVPEVTAVGGTTFKEGSGSYWKSANGNTKGSALSYIPEVTWNDSAANGSPASSGGGASQFFSKPSWQTGTGVPNDGARDVPDVAFPASADHDGYLVYTSTGLVDEWSVIGGTSAGAPAFAGVLALLNQYLVSSGAQANSGLGNINANLYPLASSTPNAFHDTTSGSNAVEACGDPLCIRTLSSSGYNAGSGYDQTTGLGSVDAYAFVTAWHSGSLSPAISLTASPDAVTSAEPYGADCHSEEFEWRHTGEEQSLSRLDRRPWGPRRSPAPPEARARALNIRGGAAGLSSGSNTITGVYGGDGANQRSRLRTTVVHRG